jgi:hypothetical protein
MILDPSCPSSTRGPTVRTVLGTLVLAGLLTACGAADGSDRAAPEAGNSPSPAAGSGAEAKRHPEPKGSAEPETGAARKSSAEPKSGTDGAAGGAPDDHRAVGADTPVEVLASDLPSAGPVATDAPQLEPIEAVFEAQEAFVPSDAPAPENPQAPGEQETTELDPAAVAAVERTADGAALQEVVASLSEFEHQGWEQRGLPVVVGEPVSAPLPTDEGEAVRVTVCLDTSGVSVVDRAGVVVSAEQKGRKALHNYDLIRQPGESWQVVQHGFPDDPTC